MLTYQKGKNCTKKLFISFIKEESRSCLSLLSCWNLQLFHATFRTKLCFCWRIFCATLMTESCYPTSYTTHFSKSWHCDVTFRIAAMVTRVCTSEILPRWWRWWFLGRRQVITVRSAPEKKNYPHFENILHKLLHDLQLQQQTVTLLSMYEKKYRFPLIKKQKQMHQIFTNKEYKGNMLEWKEVKDLKTKGEIYI